MPWHLSCSISKLICGKKATKQTKVLQYITQLFLEARSQVNKILNILFLNIMGFVHSQDLGVLSLDITWMSYLHDCF